MTIGNLPGTLGQTRYLGSQPVAHDASKVTSGIFGASRIPSLIVRQTPPRLRAGTALMGTVTIGSFRVIPDSSGPQGLDLSARGHIWYSQFGDRYITQIGTTGLRGGTPSQIGTVRIGSFRTRDNSLVQGVAFDKQGALWYYGINPKSVLKIGTLALRAGTPSRIGTRFIGLFTHANFVAGDDEIHDMSFDDAGRVWITHNAAGDPPNGRAVLFGTGALLGTDNEGLSGVFQVHSIGSFRPTANLRGVAVEKSGILWFVNNEGAGLGLGRLYRIGTLGLRGGTDSRMGTVGLGTIPLTPTSVYPQALAFSPRGELWLSQRNDSAPTTNRKIFNIGTLGRTAFGNPFPPPTVPTIVVTSVRVQPNALARASAGITQTRIGTLAEASSPAGGNTLVLSMRARILPTAGSYSVKKITDAGTFNQLAWNEWTMER